MHLHPLFPLLFLFFSFCLGSHYAFSQHFDWVQHAGLQGENISYDVATDAAGNSIIAGYYQESIKLGNKEFKNKPGSFNGFIAKYDPMGHLLWAESGAGGYSKNYAVAVDKEGNSYVAGYSFDLVTFGAFTTGLTMDSDLYVAKYNSSGDIQWVSGQMKLLNYGKDLDIKVDDAGNLYITGGLIAGTYYNNSHFSGFILKLNSKGEFQFKKGLGNAVAYAIALDEEGEGFFIAGHQVKNALIGNIPLISAGMTDIFVARYNASGDVMWVQQIGGTKEDLATDLAIDKLGNCYLTGTFSGNIITSNNIKTTAKGNHDALLAKLTPDGSVDWIQTAGSVIQNNGTSLTLDKAGNIYMAGLFQGSAIFGDQRYTATSAQGNVFIARYTASGIFDSLTQLGGNGTQETRKIKIDKNDNIFITGAITGKVNFGSISVMSASSQFYIAKFVPGPINPVLPQEPSDLSFSVQVPNIITPNGDGLNDSFKINISPGYQARQHFSVFNRYGKAVFDSSNYTGNWSAHGLAAGVYYYNLTLYMETRTKTYKGWVQVVH